MKYRAVTYDSSEQTIKGFEAGRCDVLTSDQSQLYALRIKLTKPEEAIVLVVEDNVANFVLIARMLGYMGIHCEWKTSGYEVVEYADTLPRVDLILMDIRLPYEDGYSALRKIRSSPTLKDTLVVAVTAEASREQINKAKAAGFDGFIGKPLDPDRFPDQIRRILNGEPVWEL
jgi:two-component system cell cycle response regulator DivK